MFTCVICGKEFKPKNKVQKTCCFACRQEYMRIAAKKWKEQNKDKIKQYQQTQNDLRKKQTKRDKEDVEELQQHKQVEVIHEPRIIVCEPDDPKWILMYAAAGRLDRISLLARALNDICTDKPIFTYGNLSRIWGTEKYYKLEEQAILHKRLNNHE